jgi:phosphoribosylformylglycinamidine synthase
LTGKLPVIDSSKPRPKAAIIREKGSNSEREMANAMYLAGFDVKDVHMTDLISGRETLRRHSIYWCCWWIFEFGCFRFG